MTSSGGDSDFKYFFYENKTVVQPIIYKTCGLKLPCFLFDGNSRQLNIIHNWLAKRLSLNLHTCIMYILVPKKLKLFGFLQPIQQFIILSRSLLYPFIKLSDY